MVWRRVRDSNPRFLLREHIISSDAPSTSRTTLRAIFQPNFSNLNLGKWREKLERKLFNVFNCTAKTPINQGFSRRGFQSDHWFSSAPRYDHFDTSPYMLNSQKSVNTSIQFDQNFRQNSRSFRNGIMPETRSIKGFMALWLSVLRRRFRVRPVMTTSIRLRIC